MPRAGWCRECGDWVWVDEHGACQHGHPADAVSRVHDAQPQDPANGGAGSAPETSFGSSNTAPDAPELAPVRDAIPLALGAFGVGEFPANLERFNWGAFLLPAVWGIAYTVWRIVGVWFLAVSAPLFLSIAFGVTLSSGALSIPSLIGITVISDAFLAFVRVWAGGNANRLLWDREAARLRIRPEARPKFTNQTFLSRQRRWIFWGIAGLVVGLGFTLASNYRLMQPYGLGVAFVIEPVVFLAAQIALGVWLSRKMREESPDGVTPAA